jgi:hypothetical protein
VQVQLFGQDVLQYYGLDGYSTWEFIAYEIIFFIGFFCLCWFALVFKKHQKRWPGLADWQWSMLVLVPWFPEGKWNQNKVEVAVDTQQMLVPWFPVRGMEPEKDWGCCWHTADAVGEGESHRFRDPDILCLRHHALQCEAATEMRLQWFL